MTVLGEIRPVGKNMSDPAAVHKSLLKVLDELRNRYGTDSFGLLAGFMSVVDETTTMDNRVSPSSPAHWRNGWEEKKENDQHTSKKKKKPLDKKSVVKFEDVMTADLGAVPDFTPAQNSKFAQERRPGDKSASDYKSRKQKTRSIEDEPFNVSSSDPVTIEVKPLPKIRLSLMPSPREEDEENLDEEGDEPVTTTKKEKSSSSKSKLKSSRKSSWKKTKKSKSSDREKRSSTSSKNKGS